MKDKTLLELDNKEQYPALAPRETKGGKRKPGDGGKDDEVSAKLSKANTPSEVAAVGEQFGVPTNRMMELGKKAGNFGQFRMTVGNLCRGSVNRRNEAKEKFGLELTWAQAGDPEQFKAAKAAHREKNKPAKIEKPKKVKAEKSAETGEALPGGAPTKQEAAKRGRGKKAKNAPPPDDSGSVDGSSGDGVGSESGGPVRETTEIDIPLPV